MSSASKILQILIFFAAGCISVLINDTGDLTSVAFFGYALILALQYDFFRRHLLVKLSIIIAVFASVIFISAVLKADYELGDGVPTVLFTLAYLYLIWIAFAEEIKDYIQQTGALRRKIERNRIFVEFGRNISGIIHNLKGKITAIDGYANLIADAEKDEISELVEGHQNVSAEIKDLINNLMFAVRSRQQTEEQVFSLRKLVQGTIDLFKANESFKKNVQVTLDLNDEGQINASPLETSQIPENTLRNSWEALEESSGHLLRIRLEREEKEIQLEISDEGSGIPFCSVCRKKKDCVNCGEFKIGRTSKETGTGIGMISTQQTLRKIGGRLLIRSGVQSGTTITFFFPPA